LVNIENGLLRGTTIGTFLQTSSKKKATPHLYSLSTRER
jgi:hypothetical protein